MYNICMSLHERELSFKPIAKRMIFIILFSIFCVFPIAFYLYLTWNFEFWKKLGVVGPIPRVYVGTFPKTALLDKSSNYIEETSELFR